jgi:hypothetical protein
MNNSEMVAKQVDELCADVDEFSNSFFSWGILFSNATVTLDEVSKPRQGGSRPSHAHLRTIKCALFTVGTFKLTVTITCDN